jgi:hypothetical protein
MGSSVFPLASTGLTTSDLITQPTWTLLGSVSTNTATASMSVTSIPTTYKKLKIYLSGLKTVANQNMQLRFNSDSGAYYTQFSVGSATAGTVQWDIQGADRTYVNLSPVYITGIAGAVTNALNTVIEVEDYTNATNRAKLFSAKLVNINTGNDKFHQIIDGLYRPATAAAITSLTLSGDAGSNIQFYNDNTSGMFVYGAK